MKELKSDHLMKFYILIDSTISYSIIFSTFFELLFKELGLRNLSSYKMGLLGNK
jgi:hypothetical protein